MTRSQSRESARQLAAEDGTNYGMSVLDGRWYTGSAEQLVRIGCLPDTFKLVPPDPPKPRPAQFENQMRLDGSKPRQGKLFDGADCLPGQLDLTFEGE